MSEQGDGVIAVAEGGAASGRGTLAARAYDLLTECGHPLSADVLVAHCFGLTPRRNVEFWRGQLARVLADPATFSQAADGLWALTTWQRPQAGWEATEYVVIDLETTGLGPRMHRVIELAAVRCRGAEVIDTFEALVNPHRRLSSFIVGYTGITPDMLADAPEIAEVLPGFLEFLGGDPLVGHNIAFDLGFLHGELDRLDLGVTVTNTPIDTGRLAVRLLPSLGKPSLDRLCAALGLPVGRRHRALDDALLTARAFWALGALARAQGTVAFGGLVRAALPNRAVGATPAAALRGERRTGRTLLDPTLRQSVPQKPGVYLMKDAAGEVIYVGKAKRLRDRISSYYAQPLGYTRKMDGLLESVRTLETIVVGSELEALLLESKLIKSYLPRFNVQQRYYAHYPFLKVDVASDYPRVTACREIVADGARYFGPFRSMRAVRTTIDVVHKLYPLRTCTRSLAPPKTPKSGVSRKKVVTDGEGARPPRRCAAAPCMRYQVGRCLGPCHGGVTPADYHKAIDQALEFLGGNYDEMLRRVYQQMHEAAERQDYERAARLRDLHQEARRVLVAQDLLNGAVERHNLLILLPSTEASAVNVLGIRYGRLHGQCTLCLEQQDASATLTAFLEGLRAAAAAPPSIGQEEVDQITIISRWILQNSDERTYIPLGAEPTAEVVESVLSRGRSLLRRVTQGVAEDQEWADKGADAWQQT